MEEPRKIDAAMTEADVECLFQELLRRPVGNDQYKKDLVAKRMTLRELVGQIRHSKELRDRMHFEFDVRERGGLGSPIFFRIPQDLAVAPLPIKRVLMVGSCLLEKLAVTCASLPTPCENDFYLIGDSLPENPARQLNDYDFQIVQLPLRFLLPDAAFARLSQTDIAGHQSLFAHSVDGMRALLERCMRWNRAHGILTFVFSFVVPQQNSVGRLLPRYDLRNPAYFVEKLNEAMAHELQGISNAYFFDLNEIYATVGRRYVQEDMIASFNHGGYLDDFDFDHDMNRLEPARRATDIYEGRVPTVLTASWQELASMYRTIRQMDMVKLVVLDLDDTLWRGVIGDLGVDEMPTSEGWPKGLWEALAFLKRRGILLAILSKNEESRVVESWAAILGRHLTLEDFAIRRINWRPKAENMAEIIAQVNLLPRNVVYIDDNPAQRAEIKAAFPDIRVLGGAPFTWRHILLWSAETQLPDITAESAARTDMARGQAAREEQRQVSLSREAFLASLNVQMSLLRLDSASHPRFPRALELINKTNQFNTTGRRWTREDCVAAFAAGTSFYAFEVTDIFTQYGLVVVLVVDEIGIRQLVMSCRVMGMEVETAVVAAMVGVFRARGAATIFGRMAETAHNLPCRDVYSRCGFEPVEDGWRFATARSLPIPKHIALADPRPIVSS